MAATLDEAVIRSRVKVVQGAVACSEEEALMALEGAEGDVHGALRLLDLLVKDILIVKFRFSSRRATSVSGLGYLAADTRSGRLITANTVVTYKMTLSDDATAGLPYRVIESTLAGLRNSSDINLHATLDLDAHLLQVFQPWRIEEFSRLAREGKRDELTDAVRGDIARGLREDISAEVAHELLTRVQFGKEAPEEPRHSLPDVEESEADDDNGMTIFLQSELLVAPVDGRTVETLVAGQATLVRITDTSQIGTYLATLLGGRNGPENLPLAVPVTRVERLASGRIRVEFRFGPGVMGKAICDAGIKVQVVNAPTAGSGAAPAGVQWPWVIAFAACVLLFVVLMTNR